MIFLVYGTSGSGKSSFAEKLLSEFLTPEKYYIATMKRTKEDLDAERKIARHREMRAGKGFKTIEMQKNLEEISGKIRNYKLDLTGNGNRTSSAILECVSNLCANEMFDSESAVPKSEEETCEKIIVGIKSLCSVFENLVIVSNNVFEDGMQYDEFTQSYIRALGKINSQLAKMSDKVYEVVVGIPVELK